MHAKPCGMTALMRVIFYVALEMDIKNAVVLCAASSVLPTWRARIWEWNVAAPGTQDIGAAQKSRAVAAMHVKLNGFIGEIYAKYYHPDLRLQVIARNAPFSRCSLSRQQSAPTRHAPASGAPETGSGRRRGSYEILGRDRDDLAAKKRAAAHCRLTLKRLVQQTLRQEFQKQRTVWRGP